MHVRTHLVRVGLGNSCVDHARLAATTAALGLVFGERNALDVVLVGDRDDHVLFGDQVFEEVEITNSAGDVGVLAITGETSATWTLNGTVVNLSPSRDFSNPAGVGQGLYRIENPFGSSKLTGFTLTALEVANSQFGFIPTGRGNSDFVLAGAGITTMTGVPEPGTAGALFGLGAFAALGLRRRRRHDG